MLSLIAQVSTSALVKACACRATHVDVTQDSKEKTAVTFQIVRFLETVAGTEFACRGKMTKMFLAGTWCLTNLHFFFSSFAPAQYLDESYFPFSI